MAMERLRRQMMANDPYFNAGPIAQVPNEANPTGRAGAVTTAVGTIFPSRKALSVAGVHSPTVAGISGSRDHGAFSIVMSGGYEDDQDEGEFIVYTGTGGQVDAFAERSSQVGDQTFAHNHNAALKRSAEKGQAVRVIRGPNPDSKYAPEQGYRYDGLYKVEKAYLDKGLSGRVICRYELRRLSGQPPLPTKWSAQATLDSN